MVFEICISIPTINKENNLLYIFVSRYIQQINESILFVGNGILNYCLYSFFFSLCQYWKYHDFVWLLNDERRWPKCGIMNPGPSKVGDTNGSLVKNWDQGERTEKMCVKEDCIGQGGVGWGWCQISQPTLVSSRDSLQNVAVGTGTGKQTYADFGDQTPNQERAETPCEEKMWHAFTKVTASRYTEIVKVS